MANGDREAKDKMEQLVREIQSTPRIKKKSKSTHSHYLETDNYVRFQQFCMTNHMTVNAVLDRMIADFLEAVERVEPPGGVKGPKKIA